MKKISLIFSLILSLVMGVIMSALSNTDMVKIYDAASGKVKEVEKVVKADEQWKKILTPLQYRVTQLKNTETAFTGSCPIPPKGQEGVYQCVRCGTDLFVYKSKFESGTGWPSFFEPVSDLNIVLKDDNSLGMQRQEVLCRRCDAHLGHVFEDGPPPTGKRYCINAVVLKLSAKQAVEKAAFAAGCFWGVEASFSQIKGVVSTTVGYMGGSKKNPTYEEVCSDKTGHAETVLIEYNPNEVSYNYLLEVFWTIHDPTVLNRQGPDVGSQYRSVIFYFTPQQEKSAVDSKKKLQDLKKFKKKIVTEITPAKEFYKAEDHHQKYFESRGIKPTCQLP